MGASQAKLHKAVEAELLGMTKFNASELRAWYAYFMEKYPTGNIGKSDFIVENLEFTKFGDSKLWAHVFEIIDKDDSGEISFVEYITLLSCINRGNSEEQLELLFKLYDADGDGTISKEEVEKILTFLEKSDALSGTPEEIAKKAFDRWDEDKNEAIDIHEFKKGMSRCDSVCVSLNVMNTVFKNYGANAERIADTPISPKHKRALSPSKRRSPGRAERRTNGGGNINKGDGIDI